LIRSSQIHKSKVFLKKIKLIAHGFFEVVSDINIKMADWIVSNFCVFPQSIFSFYSSAFWEQSVIITYLEQNRAPHILGMFDRSVPVCTQQDTSTGFVNKIFRCIFSKTLLRIRGSHESNTSRFPHKGYLMGRKTEPGSNHITLSVYHHAEQVPNAFSF